MGRRSAAAAAAAVAAGVALVAAPAAAQQAWSAVGAGLDGPVYALANYGGEVVAAGAFTSAGGTPALNIAVFTNASGWAPLGLGVAGEVYALAQGGNNLYVGGAFYSTGGDADSGDAVVAMSNVGVWTGTEWQALDAGVNSYVYALAVDAAGNVYVGGTFDALNDPDLTPMAHVTMWDGSAFNDLGGGVDGPVYAFALLSGAVYMGGLFGSAGSGDSAVAASNVAAWSPDDAAWADVAGGFDGSVSSLLAVGGTLYASGSFQYTGGGAEPAGANYIAAIVPADSTPAWAPVGAFDSITSTSVAPSVGDIVSLSSVLYASGYFDKADGIDVSGLARFNGTAWGPLAAWVSDGSVFALAFIGTKLYVGGSMTAVEGTAVNYVFSYDTTVAGLISPSNTPSHSPTASVSPSASVSASPSLSGSPSTSAAASPAGTGMPTGSAAASASSPPSVSASPSHTPSRSATPTGSLPAGVTPSSTGSDSPSSSATLPPSPSGTPSSSSTRSNTRTGTPTRSGVSRTATRSETATPTASLSGGAVPSSSATSSRSPVSTRTPTRTDTPSPSASVTAGASSTSSASPSASPAVPADAVVAISVQFPNLPPSLVADVSVGLALRLGWACSLGLPLESVIITEAFTGAGDRITLTPTDPVNTATGSCADLEGGGGSGRRLGDAPPTGASAAALRGGRLARGRALGAPASTQIGFGVTVPASQGGTSAAQQLAEQASQAADSSTFADSLSTNGFYDAVSTVDPTVDTSSLVPDVLGAAVEAPRLVSVALSELSPQVANPALFGMAADAHTSLMQGTGPAGGRTYFAVDFTAAYAGGTPGSPVAVSVDVKPLDPATDGVGSAPSPAKKLGTTAAGRPLWIYTAGDPGDSAWPPFPWITDGTPAGSCMLTLPFLPYHEVSLVATHRGRALVHTEIDGSGAGPGFYVLSLDGGAAVCPKGASVAPATFLSGIADPVGWTLCGDKVFFASASTGALWAVDNLTAATAHAVPGVTVPHGAGVDPSVDVSMACLAGGGLSASLLVTAASPSAGVLRLDFSGWALTGTTVVSDATTTAPRWIASSPANNSACWSYVPAGSTTGDRGVQCAAGAGDAVPVVVSSGGVPGDMVLPPVSGHMLLSPGGLLVFRCALPAEPTSWRACSHAVGSSTVTVSTGGPLVPYGMFVAAGGPNAGAGVPPYALFPGKVGASDPIVLYAYLL